uniref:IRG-type G domain-containing protein n=1 Tax=Panagrolaimus sp. JU765 TaxID=591449 RepID=A0AC34QLY9_9BILA
MFAVNESKFDHLMTIMRNAKDLSIRSLLLQIENKYPGSNAEKLRAEARNKFQIDSVYDYNFGITGQSGVGKSSLINALCGYDDYDSRAAPINIVECTNVVKRYPHPELKHLVLYDLPGGGTTSNPFHTYFCDKRLYVFDCLLLVMSQRTLETDLAIAKLALEMGTPVVFIRNKAEESLKTIRRDPKNHNMDERSLIHLTISIIKNNIRKELMVANIENPQIFVIEAHSLRKLGSIITGRLHELEEIKFEELDLLQYVGQLASARSDLSLQSQKPCEEKKKLWKFGSKNKNAHEYTMRFDVSLSSGF